MGCRVSRFGFGVFLGFLGLEFRVQRIAGCGLVILGLCKATRSHNVGQVLLHGEKRQGKRVDWEGQRPGKLVFAARRCEFSNSRF